jgi:hypothetical protein
MDKRNEREIETWYMSFSQLRKQDYGLLWCDVVWLDRREQTILRNLAPQSYPPNLTAPHPGRHYSTTRNMYFVGFEVLTAVVMKSSVFWDARVTMCSLLGVDQSFGGTCRPHLQDRRVSQAKYQHETGSKLGNLLPSSCWYHAWPTLSSWR